MSSSVTVAVTIVSSGVSTSQKPRVSTDADEGGYFWYESFRESPNASGPSDQGEARDVSSRGQPMREVGLQAVQRFEHARVCPIDRGVGAEALFP